MSVGVMKDYKLKLRKLRVSHTLGWSWNWLLGILPSGRLPHVGLRLVWEMLGRCVPRWQEA